MGTDTAAPAKRAAKKAAPKIPRAVRDDGTQAPAASIVNSAGGERPDDAYGGDGTSVAPAGTASPKHEVWKHTAAGRVFLTKFNALGQEVSVAVRGGGTVTLTPQERRLNQERCASEKLDFFKNGTLIPIRLLEDEYDFHELLDNRQAVKDDEVATLLKSARDEDFKRRLGELTNPVTVQRLIDEGGDDLTLRRYNWLKERLDEVNPDVLAKSRLGVDGGTTGLREGAPDPGMRAPETADWENFAPDITFAGPRQ